jgi:hypothetical protein
MPWVRFEDGMDEHPKVAGLSEEAFALHIHAIFYASRALTDGVIARGMVRRLSKAEDVRPLLRELLSAGLWLEHEHGFAIHDYLDYQPSRAEVLEQRAANTDRKRRQRSGGRNGVASVAEAEPESGRDDSETSSGGSPDTDRSPAGTTTGTDPGIRAMSGDVPGPPVPGPGTPVPEPIPRSRNPEPGDARATRGGFEFSQPRPKRSAKAPPGGAEVPFNDDLARRVQAIALELGDDNAAASITRAQHYQAAAALSDGQMAAAIKDAHRRTERRLGDLDAKPLGSPMAYFLGVLERNTKERSNV